MLSRTYTLGIRAKQGKNVISLFVKINISMEWSHQVLCSKKKIALLLFNLIQEKLLKSGGFILSFFSRLENNPTKPSTTQKKKK